MNNEHIFVDRINRPLFIGDWVVFSNWANSLDIGYVVRFTKKMVELKNEKGQTQSLKYFSALYKMNPEDALIFKLTQ
jgi:hypothetical protein